MKTAKNLTLTTLIAVALNGCAGGPGRQKHDDSEGKSASISGYFADITKGLRRSIKQVTSQEQPQEFPGWDWATGIPKGAPRAEQFAAVLPDRTVAQLCPDVRRQHVRLVSAGSFPPAFTITNVGGRRIRNSQDLFLAVEQAAVTNHTVQVDMLPVNSARGEVATIVDSRTLHALSQLVAPQHAVMSIVEEGNPQLVTRDGSARAKLMVRADRHRGMLQISLSLANCNSSDLLLPVEVRAKCNGSDLRCLSASETLALLYDQSDKQLWKKPTDERCSFRLVSENEDYLIPINYNSLHKQLTNDIREDEVTAPKQPALASLPGVSYPGPAILGDARALSGFLLRPQVLKPSAQTTGWIMFGGEALTDGGEVQVALDLGRGLRSYRFEIPVLD